MGMFRDVRKLTKQAKDLKNNTETPKMGDMVKAATEQLGKIQQSQQESTRILAEGQAGNGIIRAMGTPARGASQYNLDLDLEIHVGSRAPYRVTNQYIVPASAELAAGIELPVKVDREDPAKIVIDWDSVNERPEYGEIRPA